MISRFQDIAHFRIYHGHPCENFKVRYFLNLADRKINNSLYTLLFMEFGWNWMKGVPAVAF